MTKYLLFVVGVLLTCTLLIVLCGCVTSNSKGFGLHIKAMDLIDLNVGWEEWDMVNDEAGIEKVTFVPVAEEPDEDEATETP